MSSVDVVCVTYGSAASIGPALDAAPPLGDGAMIVVDHGDDGAGQIAAARGATVVLDPANPGFGAGQNRGVALGAAEFVLLLNPDCQMADGAVRAGLDHLRDHSGVAAVQGSIMGSTTGEAERSHGRELGALHLWARALGVRRLLAFGVVRAVARRVGAVADHVDRTPTAPERVETLAATAVLIRRTAFESVGGFDESYFLYGEDLDLCRRLRAAGWALVALPVPWGRHVGGASSAGWQRREVVWWEGTMRFVAQWWGGRAFLAAVMAATVRAAAIALRDPRARLRPFSRLVVAPIRYRLGAPSR